MTTQKKTYVNNDQTATFICPVCEKPRISDVSKYMARNAPIKLKVTCSCGYQYQTFLEKRKKFRKQTSLDGIYQYSTKDLNNKEIEASGRMTVSDISFNGIRIKLPIPPHFAIGDKLSVEFTLDDKNRSIIKKEVIVKNISDLNVGLEFIFNPSYDNILGFYLLGAK